MSPLWLLSSGLTCESVKGFDRGVLHRPTQDLDSSSQACTCAGGGWQVLLDKRPTERG